MKKNLVNEKVTRHDGNCSNSQSLLNSNHSTHFTHLTHFTHFRKVAFTLAEVLITLGVIGIVAAMTIPNLVQSYQEKATVTRLKKTYSVISQAFRLMVMDYGTVDQWNLAKTDTGEKDDSGNPVYDDSGQILFMERLGEYLKHSEIGNKFVFSAKVYTMNGTDTNQGIGAVSTPSIQLPDGTILSPGWVTSTGCSNRHCGDFWVIFPKKNSIVGVDQFIFRITKDNILPFGPTDIADGEGFTTHCNMKSTLSTNGRGCTAWVIQNGNMDYLHCDDLSWNGKHKCSD